MYPPLSNQPPLTLADTDRSIVGANYAEDELTEDSVLLTETGILRTQLGGLTQAGQQYVQTTDAFAVYGRADWDFAEQLSLVLEARYTEEEKGFDGSTFLPQVGATLASADESTTFDALSGKIAVEYTPTDNALLYMSYSEGFKSGGYFGGFATSNAQLQPFDNETIDHGQWPCHRCRSRSRKYRACACREPGKPGCDSGAS